ncbi:unnamed protein product [Dibothriocephalus latus]|uniref:Importin N-terminal domain-containing protein n=1 Tax=Dibothriocephalus latus TaxID=60516 RepID=A0A3P7P1X5_DIBLA|nr:unnamed protein product [Dibothriocephalus latus]
MDPTRIVEALQASLQSDQQADAEKILHEMHKIIGFAPTLLQVVLESSLELAVRQAGAVFFKNMVIKSWKDQESKSPEGVIAFHIHENDRETIRNVIVPAMTTCPIPIQNILQVALFRILKYDFPSRFPTFVERVAGYLNSTNFIEFHGSLLSVYALVQAFDRQANDKNALAAAMNTVLPHIYERMGVLLPDTSDESLSLQKLVLKIFYRYTEYYLPTDSINEQWVTHWHTLLCSILENFNGANDDADSAYWKRQKWTARILYCWFTRYGSPGNVQKKYNTFADWYLKGFTHQVLASYLKVCDAYRQHIYVSPKVLAETLSYFSAALSHAFSWKFLQASFPTLLQEVIHPLLSHDKEAQEMWEEDPIEYIRYKTSVYASLHNPADAACTFISDACSKRKGILDKSMQYCIQVLSSDAKPEAKDGALNLVGTVCDTLLKNKTYKSQLESFLITHVLPLFDAPEGYRRARACWLLGKLSRAEFGNTALLCQAAEATRRLMCFDTDLPVRVSAANAVFALIRDQDEKLIKLLRETEFDDLNSVLREIMIHYSTEIQPVAVHMLQELSTTFVKLVGVAENGDAGETNAAGDVEYNEEKEYQCLVATGSLESDDEDESNEAVHAAKMLEVLIINFRGQMDAVVPKFVELALTKLTQSSTNVELRMICLQVVIAAIVSSRSIVLPILSTHNWPGTETPIIENFLKIWLENISRFTG